MTVADQITPRQRQIVLFSALAATTMVSLDMSIANVALPEIQGGLSIAPDQLGWILTSYMIAGAIGTPLVGALVPKIGMRRFYILSIVGFGLASLACGLSGSLPELVCFRAVQGFAGAALGPLGQMLLYDIVPKQRLGRAMGLYSMGVMSGTVIGPSLGGFITDMSSWRWIFLVNLPIALVAILGLVACLPRIPQAQTRRFDYLGFTFIAVGLCAFQLFLDRGQGKGWLDSREILIELMIAGTALYLLLAHSLTTRHPFVDLALFKDRNFVIATGLNFCVSLITFMPSFVMPLFLQNVQGYDVMDTGLVLTPRGAGMVVSMFVLSRFADRANQRVLILSGISLLAVGFIGLRELTPESPASVLISTGLIQSTGLALTMLPLNLVAFSTLSAALRPMGSSLYTLFRSIATSTGTALTMSYISQSTEDNHVRLLQNISVYNPAMTGPGMPSSWALTNPLSLKLLSLEVWRQATVIAFDNLFTIGAFVTLLAATLVFFIRTPPKTALAQHSERNDLLEGIEAIHA